MRTHRHHAMHENSLFAYAEEKRLLGARARAILDDVTRNGAATDRKIMARMGFADMNSVRPRVTELIEDGYLREGGSTTCAVTGKTVRIVETT